jgi:competence ComEA-like helix-hairpin-helix protein
MVLLLAPHTLAKKKPPTSPININTASSTQLQQVPGIGPVTADKILQMRKSYGAFKNVDDLLAIRGIGPKKIEKMRKYLTVTRPVTARAAQPTHSARPASCATCAKPKPPAPTKSVATQKAPPPASSTQAPAETEEP